MHPSRPVCAHAPSPHPTIARFSFFFLLFVPQPPLFPVCCPRASPSQAVSTASLRPDRSPLLQTSSPSPSLPQPQAPPPPR